MKNTWNLKKNVKPKKYTSEIQKNTSETSKKAHMPPKASHVKHYKVKNSLVYTC